jgi:hypothetical protein
MSTNVLASCRWTFCCATVVSSPRVAGKCISSSPIALAAAPISRSLRRLSFQYADMPAARLSAAHTANPTVA